MLDLLRKNTKTIIWIVIGGFAVWGAGSAVLSRENRGSFAGMVFGEKISSSEYTWTSRAVGLLTPTGRRPDATSEDLDAETWKHLALLRQARRQHFTVSDEEVTQQIAHLFQGPDGFEEQRYRYWIRTVFGDQARKFEEQVRNFLMIQKLLESFRPLINPGDDELWTWYQKTVRSKTSAPPDDEAKAREDFEKNKAALRDIYVKSEQAGALQAKVDAILAEARIQNFITGLREPRLAYPEKDLPPENDVSVGTEAIPPAETADPKAAENDEKTRQWLTKKELPASS